MATPLMNCIKRKRLIVNQLRKGLKLIYHKDRPTRVTGYKVCKRIFNWVARIQLNLPNYSNTVELYDIIVPVMGYDPISLRDAFEYKIALKIKVNVAGVDKYIEVLLTDTLIQEWLLILDKLVLGDDSTFELSKGIVYTPHPHKPIKWYHVLFLSKVTKEDYLWMRYANDGIPTTTRFP